MKRYALILAISALLAAPPSEGSSATLRQSTSADALTIIVHRSNPADNLTLKELRRIFMLDTQTWGNGRRITVMLREKGQPERSEAIRMICGISEGQYDRHILLQTFRGAIDRGPREILSAAAMRRFVFNVPGAIGYVPAAEADDTVKVLRIDGLLPDAAAYPLRRGTRAPARGEK
jgi:ABC-type phosphate transport system substrate-binding protein